MGFIFSRYIPFGGQPELPRQIQEALFNVQSMNLTNAFTPDAIHESCPNCDRESENVCATIMTSVSVLYSSGGMI